MLCSILDPWNTVKRQKRKMAIFYIIAMKTVYWRFVCAVHCILLCVKCYSLPWSRESYWNGMTTVRLWLGSNILLLIVSFFHIWKCRVWCSLSTFLCQTAIWLIILWKKWCVHLDIISFSNNLYEARFTTQCLFQSQQK